MQQPLYIILLNACQTLPEKGGIATYTDELAHHLGKKGHAVSVLTYPSHSSAPPLTRLYGVRRFPSFDLSQLVKRGGSRGDLLTRLPPKVLAMARDTVRVARNLPGDRSSRILWAVTWWPEALAAFLVSHIQKVPYVITAHGCEAILPPHARRHFLYRKVMNEAARVFAVSEYTADALVRCSVSKERIRVVHNGVQPMQFALDAAARERVARVRERFGLEERFVLLTVARLVPRKGHLTVLQALAGLKDRTAGLRYLVVGDGPARSSLQEATRALSLGEVVVFAGEVSDQDRCSLLHACDVFVMPNQDILRPDGVLDTEGFGIVFLEASACAKPVIAGRAGGAPEAVLDGHTGILVDPSNVNDLREAILRLWTDRDLALRLGQEGQRRVERQFTWEKLTETHLNEIAALLPSPKAGKGSFAI